MSGSDAVMDRYFDGVHAYLKGVKTEDRLSAGWSINQFNDAMCEKVIAGIRERVPGWEAGQSVPREVLDEVFNGDELFRECVNEVFGRAKASNGFTPPASRMDQISISPEGRLAAMGKMEEPEETSEKHGEKVGVNAGKRARMIAAARTPSQVRQVMALLEEDLRDCKAGLERGACDESEVQKVEALIQQAKSRMAQVAGNDEGEGPGLSAFEMASLM